MHMYISALTMVVDRYAPSRILSFDVVHVFKTLQLIKIRGHVSRDLLSHQLGLGESAIKTLIKHLKMQNMIQTTNTGTKMTRKGETILSELLSSIASEMSLPKCSIALGKFNHVVLLKQFNFAIKSGIEQRDAAIMIGAKGATTLLFKDTKFIMPTNTSHNPLYKEPYIHASLIEGLKPEDRDAIIIGSDDTSKLTA
jgi:hypothetical protein